MDELEISGRGGYDNGFGIGCGFDVGNGAGFGGYSRGYHGWSGFGGGRALADCRGYGGGLGSGHLSDAEGDVIPCDVLTPQEHPVP